MVPNASFRPRTFPSIGETSIAEMSQSADSRNEEWLRKVRKFFVGLRVLERPVVWHANKKKVLKLFVGKHVR